MIFKLVKFFLKIGIAIIVSLILLCLVGVWLFKGTAEYVRSTELPYDNVSYMISSYEKNAEAEPGTWCLCPVCGDARNKKGYFYKEDIPCCSQKCEREYHEMVKLWQQRQDYDSFIEAHGKKCK